MNAANLTQNQQGSKRLTNVALQKNGFRVSENTWNNL